MPEWVDLGTPIAEVAMKTAAQETGMQRSTVLVVDDDLQLHDALQDGLESPRFLVIEARSNAEALACLRCIQIDLIVHDPAMRSASGDRFLDLITSDPRFNRIPILAVTGHAQLLQGRRVAYLLGKMSSPAMLVAAVRRHCARPVAPASRGGRTARRTTPPG